MLLSNDYTWFHGHREAVSHKVVMKAEDRAKDTLPFEDLFGPGVFRTVIPSASPTKQAIEQGVKDLGYDGVDWQTGNVAKTTQPSEKAPAGTLPRTTQISLGKVLPQLPDGEAYARWWVDNSVPARRDDSQYSIVISQHPLDVVRMSDHSTISSCFSPGDEYWEDCLEEMRHGGLVAYLVKTEDLENFSPERITGNGEIFEDSDRGVRGIVPVGRLRLRRYTSKDGDFELAIPELKTYRGVGDDFQAQVRDWAREVQAEKIGGARLRMADFVRRGGEWVDTDDEDLFNDFFGDELEDEGVGMADFGLSGFEGTDQGWYGDILDDEDEEDDDWGEGEDDWGDGENEEEDEHAQQVERMGDLEALWTGRMDLSTVLWEDDGDGFSWDGYTEAYIPTGLFYNPAVFEDGRVLNLAGPGSFKETLADNEINDFDVEYLVFSAQVGQGNVVFRVGFPSADGDPDDFNSFCQDLHDDWDQKNSELVKVIMGWLLKNNFIRLSPAREYREQSPKFRNFVVGFEDDGDVWASAVAHVGSTESVTGEHPFDRNRHLFLANVVMRAQNLVREDLQKLIAQRKSPRGYFPGMEPNAPVREVYDLDHFKIGITLSGDHDVDLVVRFQADDLTSQEEMSEIADLLAVVDRGFPRIVQECRVLWSSYLRQWNMHAEKREQLRRELEERPGVPPVPHQVFPAFTFDPNHQFDPEE